MGYGHGHGWTYVWSGQIEMELVFHVASVPRNALAMTVGVVVNVLCGSPVQQRPSPAGYPWLGYVEICTVRNRFRDNTESVHRLQLLAVGFVRVT
jgi:hypothetical protein